MEKISILVLVALVICVSGRPQGQWPYENVNQHSPSSSGYSDPSLYSYQYGHPGKSPFNYRSANFRDDDDDDDDNDDDEGVNFKQELIVGAKSEGGNRVSGGIQATPAPPRVVEPTRAPPPPTYPPFPPATPPTTTKKPAKKGSEDSSEENSDEADEDQSDEDQDEGNSDEDEQEDSPGRGPPRGQRPQYGRPSNGEFPDGYFDEPHVDHDGTGEGLPPQGYGQGPPPKGYGQGPPPKGYGQGPPQGYGQGPPQGYDQGPPQGYDQGPPQGYGQGPPGKGQQGPPGQGPPPKGYYQNDREQNHNDRPPPGPGPPPGLPSSNVRVTYSRPNTARRRSDVPVESKRGEMNSKKFIEVPAAEASATEVEKTSEVKPSEVVKSKPESLSSVSVEEEENLSGVPIPKPVVLPGSEEVVQEAEAEVDEKNEISSVEEAGQVDAVVIGGKEKAPGARPGRVEAFIPGYITNHGEILVPVDFVMNHGPISILPDPYTPVARGVKTFGGPNIYPQIGQNQINPPKMFQTRLSQQPMDFYYDDDIHSGFDFNDYA